MNENAKRDALILEWREKQAQLSKLKDEEMALRKQVLGELFSFDPEVLREGTENFELGQGYKVKAVFKIDYKLNNENDAVDKVLTKMEKAGAEGAVLAERLVKWEPKLSISEYKKLPDKFRKLIDEIVTTKEATPSVELVAPKSKT